MGVGAAARAHMRLLLCSGHATAAAAAAAQAAATGGGALVTFSAAPLLYVWGVCCCSAACLCDRCLAALMMLLHLSAFPQTQSPKHKTNPPFSTTAIDRQPRGQDAQHRARRPARLPRRGRPRPRGAARRRQGQHDAVRRHRGRGGGRRDAAARGPAAGRHLRPPARERERRCAWLLCMHDGAGQGQRGSAQQREILLPAVGLLRSSSFSLSVRACPPPFDTTIPSSPVPCSLHKIRNQCAAHRAHGAHPRAERLVGPRRHGEGSSRCLWPSPPAHGCARRLVLCCLPLPVLSELPSDPGSKLSSSSLAISSPVSSPCPPSAPSLCLSRPPASTPPRPAACPRRSRAASTSTLCPRCARRWARVRTLTAAGRWPGADGFHGVQAGWGGCVRD